VSRRPARFTEADIARVLRAVKGSGAPARIEVKPDGTILILTGGHEAPSPSPATALDEWLGGRNADAA
jgi:hypothetical protein